MRVGSNPNKDQIGDSEFFHQVIIPVYIPNLNGYFRDSLEILKICIQSLLSSSNKFTFFSFVSNGSCDEVENYLKNLYRNGEIQELIITSNIGKYNSIMKAIAGQNFPLVTISDADVYFKADWQKETFKIFENFEKVGTVGLIPQFLSYQSASENLLFNEFFSGNLVFDKILDPKDLKEFYRSIGWKPNYPKQRLEFSLYLKNNENKALVGAGHVVATYRRELFDEIPFYNPYKMGGSSETFLDSLAPKKGFYRLTTSKNMAYHLGNRLEMNFIDKLNSQRVVCKDKLEVLQLKPIKGYKTYLVYNMKRKFIQVILKSHKLRMQFLKYLGLPKQARKAF